jgi:predicted MFS family arabinose efflux permease
MVFATVTGAFMLGPLLPDMAVDLSTSVPVLAQLVTFSALSWAAAALLVGPLSDAYGRKPVLLVGAAVAGLGALGTAIAGSFAVLAGFRLLVGIGSGMIPPTAVALIGDTFPPERKGVATGVFVAMPGAANLAGIPLAAVLSDLMGWRASFVAVGLLMFLAAVAFFFMCPRLPTRSGASMDYAVRLRRVFAQRLTWYLMGLAALLQGMYAIVLVFFPPYL